MSQKSQFNVLVVDDAKANRMLIELFLKNQNYLITMADNGVEAVKFFKEGLFDLILMDIQMPILDGHGAMRQIRNWEVDNFREKTPIVALTAHSSKNDINDCFLSGCSEYLAKPITKMKLLECVKKYKKYTHKLCAS